MCIHLASFFEVCRCYSSRYEDPLAQNGRRQSGGWLTERARCTRSTKARKKSTPETRRCWLAVLALAWNNSCACKSRFLLHSTHSTPFLRALYLRPRSHPRRFCLLACLRTRTARFLRKTPPSLPDTASAAGRAQTRAPTPATASAPACRRLPFPIRARSRRTAAPLAARLSSRRPVLRCQGSNSHGLLVAPAVVGLLLPPRGWGGVRTTTLRGPTRPRAWRPCGSGFD